MLKQLCLTLLLSRILPLAAQVHQHGTIPKEDGRYNPFLAADPRGGFYLAYVERNAGVSNVMLQRSSDGKTFSAPVRVNDEPGDATVRNENPPKVAVGPKGQAYVCWANERGRWKGNVRFARSTDGGKTFSPATNINSDAALEPAGHAFQSVAVDQAGRIHVTWIDERNTKSTDRGGEIWISTSTDEGKTFSDDRRILGDVCECCRTNLQMDRSGTMFLSYRTVPASGPMLRDIVLAVSRDGGKTFSRTIVSQDGWEVNACPVAGPALVVDRQDRIGVVWFTGGGEQPGLYYAISNDHGNSFSPRKALDKHLKLGKHVAATVSSDGRVLLAWDDTGAEQISCWGSLDLTRGLVRKFGSQVGVLFPVIAASQPLAVVAGMQGRDRGLFIAPLTTGSQP
jgi:hypothetical protein